jgi:hypothetical protein
MTPGKITLVALGGIAAVVASGLVAAGGFFVWVDQAKQDDDGYLSTGTALVSTPTHALASESLDVDSDADWLLDDGRFATVRVSGASADAGRDVFIGVAPSAAVAAYLDGVAHDEVVDFEVDPLRIETERRPGAEAPAPPASEPIWAASVHGAGEQTLDWELQTGDWSVVVMNADGSAGVQADLTFGARLTFLLELGIGLLAGGVALLAGGIAMVVLGVRGTPPPPAVHGEAVTVSA